MKNKDYKDKNIEQQIEDIKIRKKALKKIIEIINKNNNSTKKLKS